MKKSFENINAVGFDIDWTLYFPKKDGRIPEKFCELIANETGKDPNEVKRFYRENSEKYQDAKRVFQELDSNLTSEQIENSIQKGIETYQNIEEVGEDERLVSLFDKLKEKYPLFIITGNEEDMAKRKLSALGLDNKLFSQYICGDEQYKREDGSAFKEMANRFNCPLENMVYVGDREKVDILPANELGMKTILINKEKENTVADYRAKDIYSIERILI